MNKKQKVWAITCWIIIPISLYLTMIVYGVRSIYGIISLIISSFLAILGSPLLTIPYEKLGEAKE